MMCRTSGSQRGVMTPMGDHNVVLGGYTKPGTAILIAASQPQAPSRLLVCMNLGEQLQPQGCTFQPAPHSLQEHSSKAVSGMQLKKKLSCWGGGAKLCNRYPGELSNWLFLQSLSSGAKTPQSCFLMVRQASQSSGVRHKANSFPEWLGFFSSHSLLSAMLSEGAAFSSNWQGVLTSILLPPPPPLGSPSAVSGAHPPPSSSQDTR